MKLIQLRLRNFRCYQDEVTVNFEEGITALVGRNDAGKSTILDALDIFFNEAALDKHDACKSGEPKDVAIICIFKDLPDKIVLDEKAPTSLKGEYLLNEGGNLEIHKVFNASLEKPKLTEIKLKACHPTAETVKDLISLTNAELKKLAKSCNANITGIDQKVNHQLRQVIREAVSDLQVEMRELTLTKNDPKNDTNAKKFWEGIQSQLPLFALFKSDRASTDQDDEAQDPLNTAVKEALKQKEQELDEIATFVRKEVQKVADSTLKKIQEMDGTLAETLSPQLDDSKLKWASLFKVSISGDQNIPVNKRGSGVRRLILLNFFRAKAELQSGDRGRSVIYAIEEPETSQHPNNQRLLFQALRDLSDKNQVVITTHTPVLTRLLPDNAVRFLNSEGNTREILRGGSDEVNQKIVDSLGILPDHNVKLLVFVEGKWDIKFLSVMSRILSKEATDVIDLEQAEKNGEVIIVPVGGSSMDLWVNGRLRELQRPEFHLYDRDASPPHPPKCQSMLDEVNARSNCKAICTNKLMGENYVCASLIIDALRLKQSQKPEITDDKTEALSKKLDNEFSHIPQLFKEHIGWKETKAKEFIWEKVAPKMTKEHLEQIDPEDEVVGWFKIMKEMMQGN